MGLPAHLIYSSADDYLRPKEYLAWEEKQAHRHEKAGDVWQGEVFTEPEQEVTFQSAGLTINLATIYCRVIFPPPAEGETEL